MPNFTKSLADWQSERFARTLKTEIESLEPGSLPLYDGTACGGLVDDSDIAATVLNVAELEQHIQVKVGIFFGEIVGGCNCGDDPVAENAYCEMLVTIDKTSAETAFEVISC